MINMGCCIPKNIPFQVAKRRKLAKLSTGLFGFRYLSSCPTFSTIDPAFDNLPLFLLMPEKLTIWPWRTSNIKSPAIFLAFPVWRNISCIAPNLGLPWLLCMRNNLGSFHAQIHFHRLNFAEYLQILPPSISFAPTRVPHCKRQSCGFFRDILFGKILYFAEQTFRLLTWLPNS